MKVRLSEVGSAALRRLVPAVVLLAAVVGVVLLLSRMHVSLSDSAAHDYGLFAIGLAAALVATRLTDFLFFDVGYRIRRGTTAPALLRQIVSLLIFGVALGALFQIVLSASLPALLATSAIITAVIGLALQETLGNLFSGLAMALERTVQVGDLVKSGETIGLVEQLSWRAIKVRTMEGHSIFIPNGAASRERLEIFRRGGPPMARVLRMRLEFSTPPERARAAILSAARDISGMAPQPEPMAILKDFGDWGVEWDLRYWLVDYARYIEVDSEIRERVWYALDRAGIVFAYPVIRQHQYAAGPLERPDSRLAVQAAVESSAIFAPLSPEERERLAQGARRRRFAPGEVVVREGDPGASMFLISGGRLAVSAHGSAAASQKVALLDAGGAFGEISLLTGQPRMATVRAVDEAVLVEIDKATLAPVLEANPSLVEKFEKTIRERRQETSDRLGSARARGLDEEAEPLGIRIARFFGLKGLA